MNNSNHLLNFFAATSFNRMAHQRTDAQWLETQLNRPDSRVIPLWNDRVPVKKHREKTYTAAYPAYRDWRKVFPGKKPPIFLGREEEQGVFYFTLQLDDDDSEAVARFETFGEFMEMRQSSFFLSPVDAALLAYARAINYWNTHHRFCGTCGAVTRSEQAGHLRVCTHETCAREHYPRTDSAIITLVHDGERCLLATAPHWPQNLYSTVAGFTEPGESLEMAVAREVEEETGVKIDPLKAVYHSSQPWPFPAGIMLGFTVETQAQPIRIDKNELADARWFSRQDIDRGLKEGSLKLPTSYSIAKRLIDDWRNRG